MNAADNVSSNGLWAHQHGILEGAAEQGCIHKTRTDIGETDVQASLMGLLL
jgi:hypothetical protein